MKKCLVFSCIISLFTLLFTGCDNFLSGADLQNEIENQIQYALSAEVDIDISPELNTGKTNPSGNKTVKISDSFLVSFKIESAYQFDRWVVIDYKTGEPLEDVLKIESPESLETKVTVLKKAENIQLIPRVKVIPGISGFNPGTTLTPKNCDTPINITFNKLVRIDSISENSIRITDVFNRNLYEYFLPPEPVVYSANPDYCTGVNINLNYDKLSEFQNIISINNGILDIVVIIETSIVDNDDLSLPEKSTNTYRVNVTYENKSPVINSMIFGKNENSVCDRTNLFTLDNYQNWSESDYSLNHTKSVWINLSASDEGSGVQNLVIKETLLFDNSNNPINSSETSVYDIEENSLLEYKFKAIQDGLVMLELNVTDGVGNESESKTVYVVKDTSFSQTSIEFDVSNYYYSFKNDYKSIDSLNQACTTVYLYNPTNINSERTKGFDSDVWYGSRETSYENFKYKISWSGKDKKYELDNPEFIAIDSSDTTIGRKNNYDKCVPTYCFKIPPESLNPDVETEYVISISDEAGNEYLMNGFIYPSVDVSTVRVTVEDATNGKIELHVNNFDNNYLDQYIVAFQKINKTTNEISDIIFGGDKKSGSTITLTSLNTLDYDYEIYLARWFNRGGYPMVKYHYGMFKNSVTTNSVITEGTNLQLEPSFTVTIESAGSGTGAYKITYTMPQELFEQYDMVEPYYFITYDKVKKTTQYASTPHYLPPMKSHSQSYSVLDYKDVFRRKYYSNGGDKFLLNGTENLYKTGISCTKGNEIYKKEQNAPVLSDYAEDNVPPDFSKISCIASNDNKIIRLKIDSIRKVNPADDSNTILVSGLNALDEHSDIALENGKCHGKIYFIKAKDNWASYSTVSDIKDLTVDEIQKGVCTEFECSPEDSEIKITCDEIISDGNYVVCLEIEDEHHNKAVKPASFFKKTSMSYKPEVTFGDSNTTINYTIQTPDISSAKFGTIRSLQEWDEVNNQWKPLIYKDGGNSFDEIDILNYNTRGKGSCFSKSLENKDFEGKFIKASFIESYASYPVYYSTMASYGYYYSIPLYFSPTKNASSGILNERADGYIPLCNEPCLISTVYSNKNLGNNVNMWEINTTEEQHLNTKVVENLHLYKPAENVPSNMYYCIIVHYADGSSEMSQVFRK